MDSPIAAHQLQPWHVVLGLKLINLLPHLFKDKAAKTVLAVSRGILLLGLLLFAQVSTLSSSGFSTSMGWMRMMFLGLLYLIYTGARKVHQVVVALNNLQELHQKAREHAPEGIANAMNALSQISLNPNGSLELSRVDRAKIPELTPALRTEILDKTESVLVTLFNAYDCVRRGEDPFEAYRRECEPSDREIFEMTDEGDHQNGSGVGGETAQDEGASSVATGTSDGFEDVQHEDIEDIEAE